MKKLQNSLYITKQGSYLHKERETLVIENEGKKLLQLPVHSIANIFCFGNVLVSPFLLEFCGENNVNLAFFTEFGRFLGRFQGRQTGNVLLRRAQYGVSKQSPFIIARNIVATKIQASKKVLQRYQRNHGEDSELGRVIALMNSCIERVAKLEDMDRIRGIEGEAASYYFSVFHKLILNEDFSFAGRNRRPPKDPINAMLSLLYSLVSVDISGALQGVGLDPQVGFLHEDRPGRDSLAQDILEEFRAWWVDRMVLSMVNLKQISVQDFHQEVSGAVLIKDEARKQILVELQRKKQEKILHPYLQEEVEIGLLPHIQAMLLARHLRGDLEQYPPFLMK